MTIVPNSTKKKINFEGLTIDYDRGALDSWSFQRKLASCDDDAEKAFILADALLCGDADEVAAALGDSIEAMSRLISAIMDDIQHEPTNFARTVKN